MAESLNKRVEKFLFELRSSADIIPKIFTEGSCFKLYLILKIVFPEAIAYWSDIENHCIIFINNQFYDIGGRLNKKYTEDKGYYRIPDEYLRGYSLLGYSDIDRKVTVERYKD